MTAHAIARAAGQALICAAAVSACRAAPGPTECVQLAETSLGETFSRSRGSAESAQQFDLLVRRCLTLPFDRELVRCASAASPQGLRACDSAFQRRYEELHGGGSER
jgi:hypothetical protein